MKVCQGTPNSHWLSPSTNALFLAESEWMTDRPTLRMITEIACDCQLGFSFGEREKQQTKGQSQFSLRYWCAFHGNVPPPQKKKKTQQFPGLMGLRAAWERSLETTSQRQQAEATLNRFRVVVWHLTDKLPQFADDDEGEGASRWKRSTILCLSPLCVHVAALSIQSPSTPALL